MSTPPLRLAARAISVVLLLLALGRPAWAQELRLHVDSEQIYAALPFVLSIEAQGFEENPAPKVSPIAIPNCRVTPLGMTPNVSQMVSIIGGQQTVSRSVTQVFRYRIEASRPGTFTIPAITVEQGSKRAQSSAVRFTAVDVPPTRDMVIRLHLPERPIWVGESFELGIDWYLRRQPQQQVFVVPLLEQPESFEVAAPRPSGNGREPRLAFLAGSKNLELPYQQGNATLDGGSYTRYRFTAIVTALKPGTLDLAPARVVAQLEVGQSRDIFGFPSARMALYKAEDIARTLEVRPAPAEGRPKSFAGAVGKAYSIEVQADRTVVRVGDPIELRITVRGDHMEGLRLPAPGAGLGLSPDLFSLPDDIPPGEQLDDDAKDASGRRGGKLFRLSVRLKNASVHEIPPLSLSFFNPETGKYATASSQPIALSVRGAAVVGASEVQAFAAEKGNAAAGASGTAAAGAGTPRRGQTAIGADLALGDEKNVYKAALGAKRVLPIAVALYGLPLLVLGWSLVRLRSRAARHLSGAIAHAWAALERELAAAATSPARDAAPKLVAALKSLGRAAGSPASETAGSAELGTLHERLEAVAYDPRLGTSPLDTALLDAVRSLGRRLTEQPRRTAAAGTSAAAQALGIALSLVLPGLAHAQTEAGLTEARALYQRALATPDLEQRAELFARTESLLAPLAAAHPDCPELLTDWGNAALGARDFGKATLAYRRALRLSSSAERARRNLDWVRSAMPDWLPRPSVATAMDSLFFWHHGLSVAWRHLLGALAFAAMVLLLAPLAADAARRRTLRRLAIVPAIVWVAMVGSLLAEGDATRDAVVQVEGTPLRAADSLGAPLALPQPLPAGAEVTVVEQRSGFTRVRLGNSEGWVERSSLEPVEPR